MADLPFLVELNEQNLTETLQRSINFYAPSHKESADFAKVLQRVAEQHQGQFILGLVNCETEQMIAAQFRIQALPTTYLFKEAQALDAFPGALDEASLLQRLSAILPKEEDLKFQKALDFLQVEDYDSALPLLKEAWELSDKKNSDVAQIPIQDRDSRWHGLQAQIELLIKAADTPEIQQLQADYVKNPTPEIALKLAVQLHQANRNDEALDLLFSILKQDLYAENGEVKQQFLSILSAIGNADPITNKYRRLLYSLLY